MSGKGKRVATYLESGRAGTGAMSSEWSADDPLGFLVGHGGYVRGISINRSLNGRMNGISNVVSQS